MNRWWPESLAARASILGGGSALGGGLFLWLVTGAGPSALLWLLPVLLAGGGIGWAAGRGHASQLRSLVRRMSDEDGHEEGEPANANPSQEMAMLSAAWAAAHEKMEAIFEAQKDFTANAAHELKTPLAALRVAGESAMGEGSSPSELEEAVVSMLEETDRLTGLVDRLLLLARAESGRIPVQADYVPAGKVVREVHDFLAPLAEERGQTLVIEEEDDWSVWADPDLLRLALENLVSNAIRHTPRGTGIRMTVRRMAAGGVAIEVIDNGPGVPAVEHRRIFERFQRGRGATVRGAGLGLPLARWAVEAFGGSLEMKADLENGACFRLRCPETEWENYASGTASNPASIREPVDSVWMAAAEPGQIMARLAGSRQGLDAAEANERLEMIGPNRIDSGNGPVWGEHLWRAVRTPFNGILSLCILLSLVLGEWRAATLMGLMILISSALRFWQERRSIKSVAALEDLVAVKAAVARPGKSVPVPTDVDELVPGDVVHLSPGDMVPADLRLITASGLRVSESSLSGESFPVAKTSRSATRVEVIGQMTAENLCFMGTHVVGGSGVGVVYATGPRTTLGQRTRKLGRARPVTAFEHGVRQVSLLLICFMAVLVPLVFLINGSLKGDWTGALLFALAVAVGLTPELLPVIVNVNLARAARLLAGRGLIIKDLPAVHAFGSMDLLCIDKTGTLTLNQPRLASTIDTSGSPDDRLLTWGWLTARFEPGGGGALDEALLRAGNEGLSETEQTSWRRIGGIPFDHERQRVSVVVRHRSTSQPPLLICKGAPESLLNVCTSLRRLESHSSAPLDPAMRENLYLRLHDLLSSGARVLAVGVKEWDDAETAVSTADESELCFAGFLVFDDTVRPEAEETLAELARAGVTIKLLTGDHPETAVTIARAVGFQITGPVITGERLRAFSDPELAVVAAASSVFARLSPMDKARLVRVLRESGSTVGFLGEGANDANALREADVGIAAQGAAPLARDCAEVVLADNDLRVCLEGVRAGRVAFGNILKYVKITASSNFGNAFSVLIASVILPFLPMRAVQLVAQNLLYDLAQLFLPWDRVDRSFTRSPRPWSADSIGRFMLIFGPLSSIFDVLTFAVLWHWVGANTLETQGLFQTGWFIVGLTTQLAIIHILRTGRLPFFESRATAPVATATLVAAAVGLALPFSPAASWFGFEPMPVAYLGWVVIVIAAYTLSAEVMKRLYQRWTGHWL